MIITNEEQEERRKLVGYCEHCAEWYKFTDDPENPSVRNHPVCGGKPSSRTGFQLTTQRTFNPAAKKISKAAQKRMGMGA